MHMCINSTRLIWDVFQTIDITWHATPCILGGPGESTAWHGVCLKWMEGFGHKPNSLVSGKELPLSVADTPDVPATDVDVRAVSISGRARSARFRMTVLCCQGNGTRGRWNVLDPPKNV